MSDQKYKINPKNSIKGDPYSYKAYIEREDQGEIPALIGQLQDALTALEQNIASLENKLSPVLCAGKTAGDATGRQMNAAARTEMGEQLSKFLTRALTMERAVAVLVESCEL